MNPRFNALRPAAWPARIRGMFNLNDPQWGRGDQPTGGDDPPRPDDRRPPPPPPPPPRGQGPNAGPPDLDELWRDFNRKLGGMLGGRGGNRGGRGNNNGGPGGNGGGDDFQPNMRGAVLRRHPGLVLAIAHMGLPEYAEFFDLAERYPRLRLDTTMAFTDFTERMHPFPRGERSRLASLGERILFGSDYPNIPYPYLHAVESLVALDLGDAWTV